MKDSQSKADTGPQAGSSGVGRATRAGVRGNLIAFAVAAALATGSARAGIEFEASTSAGGGHGRLEKIANASVRGWADGALGKVAFSAKKSHGAFDGRVLLSGTNPGEYRWFDPQQESCGVASDESGPDSPHQVAMAAATTLGEVSIERQLDEDGGKVAGQPTRHTRYAIGYQHRIGKGDAARSVHTSIVLDLWTAPALTEPGLMLWLKPGTKTALREVDRKLEAALTDVPGAMLKRTSTISVQVDQAPARTTSSTLEVTRIKQHKVKASIFKPPFDCKALTPSERR